MCDGVRHVVCLVSVMQGYEDAQVMYTGGYADAGACKTGADLVETSCCDTLLRTTDKVGRNRRVV